MSSSTFVPFNFLTPEELENNFYNKIVKELVDKHINKKVEEKNDHASEVKIENREELNEKIALLPKQRRSQVIALRDRINEVKAYPIAETVKAKIITASFEDFEKAINDSYTLIWRMLLVSPKNSVARNGIRPSMGITQDNVYDKKSSLEARADLDRHLDNIRYVREREASIENDEYKRVKNVLLAELQFPASRKTLNPNAKAYCE